MKETLKFKTSQPKNGSDRENSKNNLSIEDIKELARKANYNFNQCIEKLINNSPDSRPAKRNKRNNTNFAPRRLNNFIIYTIDKTPEVGFKFKPKIISKMW